MTTARNTVAQLGLVALTMVGGCSDSHGRDEDAGAADVLLPDSDLLYDAPLDAPRDTGTDAGTIAPCAADRVANTVCLPSCDGPPTYHWNGDSCFPIGCGECVGEDCDAGTSSLEACGRARRVWPAALPRHRRQLAVLGPGVRAPQVRRAGPGDLRGGHAGLRLRARLGLRGRCRLRAVGRVPGAGAPDARGALQHHRRHLGERVLRLGLRGPLRSGVSGARVHLWTLRDLRRGARLHRGRGLLSAPERRALRRSPAALRTEPALLRSLRRRWL